MVWFVWFEIADTARCVSFGELCQKKCLRTRRARRLEHQPLEHDILRLRLIATRPRHVVRNVPDHGSPASTRGVDIVGDVAAVVELVVIL
jgi:hypothetical protein